VTLQAIATEELQLHGCKDYYITLCYITSHINDVIIYKHRSFVSRVYGKSLTASSIRPTQRQTPMTNNTFAI